MSPGPNQRPADNDPDSEHYLVRDRADFLPILQAMVAHKVPVQVHLSGRPVPAEVRLLSVKPQYEELLFDATGMADLTYVEGKTTLSARASYDYLHIQFESGHVETVSHRSGPAFRACIPAAVTRSQRRGSIRFPVPSDQPPVVRMRWSGRFLELRMRVMDISLGGVCLILEDRRTVIPAGAVLSGCKLELPGRGSIDTDLKVGYVDQIDSKSGWRRLGCRFSGLSMPALERVREYVTRLERIHLAAPRSSAAA